MRAVGDRDADRRRAAEAAHLDNSAKVTNPDIGGGGVATGYGNFPTLINCTIANNTSAVLGGGVGITDFLALLAKWGPCP